ncbi:MAG: glycoside hydrolase family 127 protein [Clostridiales bacterium]|nr:glycoside hydrolase family 127 protein [Clostridiales bacterium]
MKNISFDKVTINDGFWKDRQTVNATKTIPAVMNRFKETGRFAAFQFDWHEGMPNKPHYFWDSDVAKWIESVAYLIAKEPHPELESEVDSLIDNIEKNQQPDGYFNIYFTVCEPEHRFFNRDWHELYCAGHLTEAAVAYYNATGKDKMLKCMCRYLELIEKVFKIEDSAAFHTPGHEEIELALVKLYHCTGEKRWLELAKYFIDKRGTEKEVPEDNWCTAAYYQSDVPVRNMSTAYGHAVRAVYLYSAMADIAREYDDTELKDACIRIFDDIYTKKLYVTGGIGQSYAGEAFTVPYDLPNSLAYTETCAAIGLCYFANRMLSIRHDVKYADVIEKAIFNGILSGVSLDGEAFFYKNPLEILHAVRDRNITVPKETEHYPESVRQKIFDCSCCPPNIARFIASIGDYIYAEDEDNIYINQFIASSANVGGADIEIKTGYPYDGEITIDVKNNADFKAVCVRIPGWTQGRFDIAINQRYVDVDVVDGYAVCRMRGDFEIILQFDILPRLYYANPRVNEDVGKCCIIAGPLVYCSDGADNGCHLRNYFVEDGFEYFSKTNEKLGTKDFMVKAEKLRRDNCTDLYSRKREFNKVWMRMIPYYAFGNRGEADMTVWLSCR